MKTACIRSITRVAHEFGVAELGLQGLNRGIQFINQMIQTSRLKIVEENETARVEGVGKAAAEYRRWFLAYLKLEKRGVEVESPLEHVKAFQGLAVTYGYTREDALENMRLGPNHARKAGPGENSGDGFSSGSGSSLNSKLTTPSYGLRFP